METVENSPELESVEVPVPTETETSVETFSLPDHVTQAQNAITEEGKGTFQNPDDYTPRYDRQSWNYGADIDGDGMHTRDEVLLEQSVGNTRVNRNKFTGKNQVTSGQWEDKYSGEIMRHKSDVEIDHVIPLYWADRHGGNEWSDEDKSLFANDPQNLLAVSALQNQVKGADGTDKYLPQTDAQVPEYVELWRVLLDRYPNLQMSEQEDIEFRVLETDVALYKDQEKAFQRGELSLEELNKFASSTFKNNTQTQAYLQKQYDQSSPDAKEAAKERSELFQWALENKDVKYKGASSTSVKGRPLADPSFMTKLDASFSSLNSLAQLSSMAKERSARKWGTNGIPREELLKDVPKEYHHDIIEASELYNDDTAKVVRENILEDISDNKIMSDMVWYAQLGFGGAAVIADPLTLVSGAGIAKTAVTATRATRSWQVHGAFKQLGVGSAWLAAGATEGAIQAAPKLAADYTYNSSDYLLDVAASGLLGSGLGLAVDNGKKLYKHMYNRVADKARIDELAKQADVYDIELSNMDDLTPAQRWEEIKANTENVDLVNEGVLPVSTAGKKVLADAEKQAKKDYAKAMSGDNIDVPTADRVYAKSRITAIDAELKSNDGSKGSTLPLQQEKYLLQQVLRGNATTEGLVEELKAGTDIDAKVKAARKWERRLKTPEQKAAGKAAYANLVAERKNSDNFDLPEKPAENLPSPREVEIERRLNIQRLKDEYADTIQKKNDELAEGMRLNILNQTGVERSSKGAYTSKEVTGDTADTATLATEIHNGQPVLVEVQNKGDLKVVPNDSPNISNDIAGDIDKTLKMFDDSGQAEIDSLARKSNNAVQSLARKLNWAMANTDITSKFADSGNKALQYIASTLTETGQGFGGVKTRGKTAAISREHKYRDAQMELVVPYKDATQAYAAEMGKGKVAQMRAMNEAGVDNEVVEAFNREFITLQELRRQDTDTDNISQVVKDFADAWNKSMDISFNHMVNAKVAGFSKNRKIDNYYTQSWLPEKMSRAVSTHGQAKVRDVLSLGYKTAAGAKDELTEAQTREMAEALMAFVDKKKSRSDMADDEFVSTAAQDARSKARLSINTTAEIDGLSVMDLLDTEVIAIGSKYNNRAAGWSAMSEATGGLLNSDKAIQEFKKKIKNNFGELSTNPVAAKAQQIERNRLTKYYEDVVEMMLGKPVRGGLSPALREFKDLTALTQLSLGMPQLAETGQVVTRNVLKLFSDPKNLARMLKDAGSKGTVEELSTEAQRLSHMTDDMEWLERQSTHTDTVESIGKFKLALHTSASTITGGNRLKANAGRAMGKISGLNIIRKAQTRVAHANLMREISDQLTKGKSSMGVDRLRDIGILNQDGTNPWLAAMIRKHGDFDTDGNLVKMNFERWPKTQQEQVSTALLRDDAQNVQKTMIGELPGWMNTPLASLLLQYREMPMVAMNKSLGRATAFADREAVMAVMLSTMTAGIAMSGRQLTVAGYDSAITGEDMKDLDLNAIDVMKYVNMYGMYPDHVDLVLDSMEESKAGTNANYAELAARQVPVLGLMKAYKDSIKNYDDREQLMENARLLVPLQNVGVADAALTFILEQQ